MDKISSNFISKEYKPQHSHQSAKETAAPMPKDSVELGTSTTRIQPRPDQFTGNAPNTPIFQNKREYCEPILDHGYDWHNSTVGNPTGQVIEDHSPKPSNNNNKPNNNYDWNIISNPTEYDVITGGYTEQMWD